MLNRATILLGIFVSSFFVFSCTKWENETVESTYLGLLPPEPNYSFKRGGTSSVDVLECSLLKEGVDQAYRYLHEANFTIEANYQAARNYYEFRAFGLHPKDEIALSSLHASERDALLARVEEVFNTTCELSGYGKPNSADIRKTRAAVGQGGYLGRNFGDENLCFVDAKGVSVAELFKGIAEGAIYLDKILNVHLDHALYNNPELQKANRKIDVLPGRNYTALEHHWDLAYGYYKFWQGHTQGSGLALLRDSKITLYNAFARGRGALTRYRYDSVELEIKNIRTELSRVVAVRAIRSLVGENVTANLREEIRNTLFFLSQACGNLYTLCFARRAEGDPYFSYAEVQALYEKFLIGTGLWDVERLRGDATVDGSLEQIAQEIAKRFDLKLEDIRRQGN